MKTKSVEEILTKIESEIRILAQIHGIEKNSIIKTKNSCGDQMELLKNLLKWIKDERRDDV